MTKETLKHKVESPWLSAVLLLAAYLTYGGFLHSISASSLEWGITIVFAIALSAICTIGWKACRNLVLLGFQSDLGYLLMALLVASLAVVAVYQFRMFTNLSLLVAVSLLTRVDMLIARMHTIHAFLGMVSLSLLGLGLAWILHSDLL